MRNDAYSPLPNGRGRETYGAAVSRTGEGVASPPAKSTLTRYANAKGISCATSPVKGEVNEHIRRARILRVNMTDAERRLWKVLRTPPFDNWKFRRQHPIGSYIADFICVEARLIIEADGGQHCENKYDDIRTAWLEKHGWHIARFWNNDILQNIEGVSIVLQQKLTQAAPHRPLSLTGEGQGEGAKAAAEAPSPVALRAPTSPVQGEVNAAQTPTGISLEGSAGDG